MLKTLLGSVREYKKESFLTPAFVTVEVLLECLIPLAMAELVDVITGNDLGPIIKYGVAMIIMALFSLIAGTISGMLSATAACGFAKNLRQDLYFKVQEFSFADVDSFTTSSLITRLTTDVTNVQNAYQMVVRIAVRTPLMLIFSIVMSLTINAKMACIFLVMLPVLAVAIFAIVFKVHPIFKRIFKKYDAMNNSVQENVSGIRVVKSFVREDYEIEKFGKASEQVRQDFTYAEKLLALNSPIMMFFIYLGTLLVCYFGASLIVNSVGSSLTTGELSSLINYSVQILSAIMMLSNVFVMVSMATESATRIVEVLDHTVSLASPETGKTTVPDGSIVFDHVSFQYAGSNKNTLSDINLNIKSGQTVGIIGSTGSSKTSLIQLISRLYDTTEGTVAVGGTDVREYDIESLRESVSVVLQKNVLFSGTVKENLRWGDENASEEELQRVCRLACADEFIQQLPDKYDTYVERGGTNFSGGQRQRLCIARALLKKPKILILDDSTSAVDTKTDAMIRKAMKEEIPNTTKIIIAQRVGSVEEADVILVMENGRIVEQGNHSELMALGGIYSEVYDSQTKRKEDGTNE